MLNPSDATASMKLAVNNVKLAAEGTLWQMAPKSLNAVVTLGKPPEVSVDEHKLGALPETIDAPPISISIYSYAVK